MDTNVLLNDLNKVLVAVSAVQAAAAAGIPSMLEPTVPFSDLRADVPMEGINSQDAGTEGSRSREAAAAMSNAPVVVHGYIAVPKVLE
jgi:Asp-tRNA(Asn)/Glu-tRNA(Gln) amidotransferase C subunit